MEENVIQEEKIDNIDNVLYSVSDEYLAKKKRNRIISYSIISFIVFALATVIIVMSCIKIDLRPQFMGRALSYRVTIANSEVMTIDENSEEYDEFNKLYLNSFKSQYLTALFTGKIGGFSIEDRKENFYVNNTTSPSSELKSMLGENYVRVTFAETNKILNSNGSEFVSSFIGQKFTFNELYFNLSTNDSQQDLTLYLGGILEGTSAIKIIEIKVPANTYQLYKFVTEEI